MPASIRHKVRYQVEQAAAAQDDALIHLQLAEQLSAGRSTPMKEKLPLLVAAIDAIKKALLQFRGEL